MFIITKCKKCLESFSTSFMVRLENDWQCQICYQNYLSEKWRIEMEKKKREKERVCSELSQKERVQPRKFNRIPYFVWKKIRKNKKSDDKGYFYRWA